MARIRYIVGPDASIDIKDRGLAYGDGLFETMAVRKSTIRFLDLHLDRLELGCRRLAIPVPERTELARRVLRVCDGIAFGHLKLILTRGCGPRGYAPPAAAEAVVILLPFAQEPSARGDLRIVTLSERLGENPKLAGIKHLCRLEQVLGQLELRGHDADEGIMLSLSGRVIGGTSRNLFAVFGQRLSTPGLSQAGIEGVMRRAVLEKCSAIGIAVEVAALRPDELANADEIFMTNALVGIQSVAKLDGRALPSNAMASTLRTALELNRDV